MKQTTLILLLIISLSTHANLLVVDSNEDVVQVDNNCTLREAITAANFDITVDQCGTGSGDDLIWVLLGTSGDAIILNNQLGIIDGVEIQGPGADNLVLAPANGHTGHIFQINTDRVVTLKDFRIGGAQSSAIDVVNVGDLTIEDMRFLNNEAATGIDGGAIYADTDGNTNRSVDAITIIDSEFRFNQATRGGALAISGEYPVVIENTIFEGNSSSSPGGAIIRHNGDREVFTATLNITDSQFIENTSNTTGGALSVEFGFLNISQSLFHQNEGQNVLNIVRSVSTIENSLFAENPVNTVILHRNFTNSSIFSELTLSFNTFLDNQNIDVNNTTSGGTLTTYLQANVFDGDDATHCQGIGIVSLGNNYQRLGADCAFGMNDFFGTDPELLPLALYNGDVLIAPPSPISPLVDSGSGCSSEDLSGEGRSRDGDADGMDACDVGAVERPDAYNLNVDNIGNGDGQVDLTEFAMTCYSPDDCDWPLEQDLTYLLEPVADNGSQFVGWGGACNGNGNCLVTMNGAKNVTAEFALVANPAQLTVVKDLANPALEVTVTSSPAGINCGNNCSSGFSEGDLVTLVAEVEPGTLIDSWQNCDIVLQNGRLCRVGLTADTTVTIYVIADPDVIFTNGFEN